MIQKYLHQNLREIVTVWDMCDMPICFAYSRPLAMPSPFEQAEVDLGVIIASRRACGTVLILDECWEGGGLLD